MTDRTQAGDPEATSSGPGATDMAAAQDNGWIEAALARVSRNIVLVSAIIGVFVTMGQSLTSCSQDNIERYKTFREAVTAEEHYWESLFDRLLAVTEEKGADPLVKSQKLAIIDAMSKRDVPPFSEHQLGIFRMDTAPQAKAQSSIETIKHSLREALADPRAVGTGQADITQTAIFQGEQQALLAPRETVVDNSQIAGKASQSATASQSESGLTYQAQTLATGSADGWDIDVFWCAGGVETARYNAGRLVASALAAKANSDQPTLDGMRLGRIRLRVLPTAMQALGSYPSSGNEVRGEAKEKAEANALVSWLTRRSEAALLGISGGFVRRESTMVTPFYLSVFVCSVAE